MAVNADNAHAFALSIAKTLFMNNGDKQSLRIVDAAIEAIADIEDECKSAIAEVMATMHQGIADRIPVDSEIGQLVAAGLKYWMAVAK